MHRISIITPLFKGEQYISRLSDVIAKNAVRARSKAEIEWVLVNDDPDSQVLNIPDVDDVSVNLITTDTNRGIQKARLVGLDSCTGDFVLFLDQDDLISDNWIQSQINAIGDSAAVVSDCLENGHSLYSTVDRPELETNVSYEYNLTQRCGFIPGQVLIRKERIPELWKRVHLKSNYCDDYYLWLCMFAEGSRFKANKDAYYEHIVNGRNQSYKIGVWVESTHELMNILMKHKVFSEHDSTIFLKAREREIEETVERLSWDAMRTEIFKGLLRLSDNESDSLAQLRNKKIAVYGIDIGEYVHMALARIGIEVTCYIDKKARSADADLPVFSRETIPSSIDIVINTLLRDENKRSIREYIGEHYPDIDVIDVMEMICR